MSEEGASAETAKSSYVWKPWKIGGLVFAGLLVAAGGLLALGGGEESPTGDSSAAPGLSDPTGVPGPENSLLPGHIPESTPAPEASAESATTAESEADLSPALLRGGLSFFLAFALGFAARTFIRIALFFVGVWAASLFLLSSVGWVEVHWDLIDTTFSGWADGVGAQFASFTTFITGSLPQAGMASLGLFTGLRRK